MESNAAWSPLYPTIILVLLLSLPLLLLMFQSKTAKRPNLPPGPSPWPIIGNVPNLFTCKPFFRWIFSLMKEMDTDILCIRLANVHGIPVNCPEIAREFLKKQDAIFCSRPITMATEYSSRGFQTIAVVPWGDQWKKMRRVVASEVITPARIRWLHDKRVEEADNLVRYIYNQSSSSDAGRSVNIRTAVRQYSANAIKRMMFDRRYFRKKRKDGGPGPEEEEYVDALFTVISLLYAFCVSDYIPWLRCFDLNGHEKIMKKAIKIVNKYHDPVIDERIQRWTSGEKEQDLLDVLMSIKDSNGKPLLSTEEIKAQAAELIYAAVDNPSNAVEWAMAEMLNQPEILNKAVEELDRVVGKERLVQESDFPQLNYVKACAREAFRLHPVAPFNLPHVSSCDTEVAGYFIPKGSHVLLSRAGRNAKVWDDPLKFKPERHLNGMAVDLAEPDLRFISFSTGRRGCMGVQLGTAMTVMLLARILQGFNWSLPIGQSSIDLSEGKNDLILAEALHAQANPRLPQHVYAVN